MATKKKATKRRGPKKVQKKERLDQATTMKKYREKYTSTKNAAGNHTMNCGDDVAEKLAALSPAQVVELAEKLCGFKKGELSKKYENLNPGSQRMNAGNRIRAGIKRGDFTIEAL